MAGLSVLNASSVALLLNSGIPRTGVYSGIRVGSVAICCLIFRIRGSHVVCPCSPTYSGHRHKYQIRPTSNTLYDFIHAHYYISDTTINRKNHILILKKKYINALNVCDAFFPIKDTLQCSIVQFVTSGGLRYSNKSYSPLPARLTLSGCVSRLKFSINVIAFDANGASPNTD